MALPKLNVPTYELVVPSTDKKIKYRPFLVKEEKVLLMAMESGKTEDILQATKTIVDECTFSKLKVIKSKFMRDSFNQRNFHLLKKGDPIALVNIYARYRRQLFWVGKQKMGDEFVIESLVQDAFLKLWEHRDRIEDPDHIYYFLRYVIKTECTYYYCRPKNQFYRSMARLENFGNYQEFMLGHDPNIEDDHLKDQCLEQEAFDRIKEILPLLSSEKSHLIELCLKHGFRYKYIGQLMGKGVTETSNQVKKTIQEIGYALGPEFASGIADITENTWSGPVISSYGYHLIKIENRLPAETIAFESIADKIHYDLVKKKAEVNLQLSAEALRSRYPLVHE